MAITIPTDNSAEKHCFMWGKAIYYTIMQIWLKLELFNFGCFLFAPQIHIGGATQKTFIFSGCHMT